MENNEVFPDLLFSSDQGVFYAPNSYLDPGTHSMVDLDQFEVISEKLETRGVFSADLNNDGSQDLISVAGRKVSLHLKKGMELLRPSRPHGRFHC